MGPQVLCALWKYAVQMVAKRYLWNCACGMKRLKLRNRILNLIMMCGKDSLLLDFANYSKFKEDAKYFTISQRRK